MGLLAPLPNFSPNNNAAGRGPLITVPQSPSGIIRSLRPGKPIAGSVLIRQIRTLPARTVRLGRYYHWTERCQKPRTEGPVKTSFLAGDDSSVLFAGSRPWGALPGRSSVELSAVDSV